MQILDNFLILLLHVLAFLAGKKISDNYNARQIQELQYQLRLQAAQKGVGFVAPPPPQRVRRVPIGQPFMDKLKENGRATQRLDKNQS